MSQATHRLSTGPYPQEFRAFFGRDQGLPSENVLALAVDAKERVWAGTDKGLAVLNRGRFARVGARGLARSAVRALLADTRGRVWAASEGGLRVLERGKWSRVGAGAVALAEAAPGEVWAVGRAAVWQAGARGAPRIALPEGARPTSLAWCAGTLWLGTLDGLFALGDGQWEHVLMGDGGSGLLNRHVYCLMADGVGHLWIGHAIGGNIFDCGKGWYSLRGEQGLPLLQVRVMAKGPNGERWFGGRTGAAKLERGQWHYYSAQRWLPALSVQAIAVGPEGTAWLGTPEGLSRIEQRLMTLEEKALIFETQVQARHNRYGFVTVSSFKDADNFAEVTYEASDNDGLWSALYCAAECYRYAATGDEEGRRLARKTLNALIMLAEKTSVPGLVARALVRKGEKGVEKSGGEWYDSPDGKWEWKADTSSDEIDGHYFAYSIYYDLVADEREKGRLRRVVRRMTDYIMANGYLLIDVDGEPTTWGFWNPERLNYDWPEQKGLNALEVLSHLKVAYYMTGEEKYQRAYLELIKKHHYGLNVIDQKVLRPGSINHSDDELAFTAYYPLLKYERDPDLRAMLDMSMRRSWAIERPERCPWFNFIYGAVTGDPCDIEGAVRTLREIPMDLRYWAVRNSLRADLPLDPHADRFRHPQATEALPADERPMFKWNGNPYELDGGGSGASEEDATFFLLPYWMGRYYGFIQEGPGAWAKKGKRTRRARER